MQAQKASFFIKLILVILFATSCTQATTVTPQILSSPTPIRPVNTITPAPILTPTPTNTPTAIPTLSAELARARLLELLATNSNCRLPCLWGITPGSSTYQDAQNILAPLASIADPTFIFLSSSPGSIDLTYDDDDLETRVYLRFLYGNDEIINRMAFQAREFKKAVASDGKPVFQYSFDSKTFDQRVLAYRLSQVLTEQGIPAAVLLQTYGAQAKFDGGFEIVLFYPNQGLLVHYTTQMHIVGNKVRGCPANAHVEFELYPSGYPNSYSEFLAQTEWASLWPPPTDDDNPFWKPIEQATTMSLEQFYVTFRQSTDKCIETPVKGWYVPNQ